MKRGTVVGLTLALIGAFAGAASAGEVLDRIRAEGTIRCGSAERPGLMTRRPGGPPQGLFVDLCRAAGIAAAGHEVAVAWTVLDADPDYDQVRAGRTDLVFLDGAPFIEHELASALLPGPPVAFETTSLLVPDRSPAHRPDDLAGEPICFLQGEASHGDLEAWFGARHLPMVRMGFQEPGELTDAFDAGRCKAIAGRTVDLAALRRGGGPERRGGRILDEALETSPVLAATPLGDGGWAAVIAWTVASLENADRPAQAWSSGADALPVEAPALGLEAGWQKRLLAATGTYASMVRRNLGAGSPLNLPPGPDALAAQGGLLTPLAAD